jgi:hypothetical protein
VGSRNYKITVRTFDGNILTFTVAEYEIEHGHVVFYDQRQEEEKRFPVQNTQIEGGPSR